MVINRSLAYLQDDRQLDSSDGDQPSSSLFTGRTIDSSTAAMVINRPLAYLQDDRQLDISDGDQPSSSSSTGR
ncbi:hypothetical protein RRG08_001560 [Elysia crispata]|uniref:Uncharacterized protein n=1 Tax=Elysia crispata TaxID=231223 RepID=A0AAE1AK85_9GAST|nr:hypothetical protein RRG08_001560 [Elysia crispata]